MTKTVLKIDHLTIKFGGLVAVDNFDLTIGEQELIGLIGPNGAGKTTIFNMVTGVYPPTAGSIDLQGESILGLRPDIITQKGIARTFQNIRLFRDLSVLDNIRIASHYKTNYNLFDSIFRTGKMKAEEKKARDRAMELLKIFKLDGEYEKIAGSLPYGQQRRLEIARALATEPQLLLLDEPAAGMNPNETAELTELIRWIRDEFKIVVFLIEHDMNLVMKVCERIAVVDYGKKIAEGDPAAIRCNPLVIEAYLGATEE